MIILIYIYIYIYYTLRFYFPYLSLLAQLVNITLYGPRDWTASFSIRFRNGTCIIILDKKYNIANSSCHFGSYGSIWTAPSPKKYYMDLRIFGPYNIVLVTDRSIYCHMTLSAMNYLLYIYRRCIHCL
jgi:hypothetical protein